MRRRRLREKKKCAAQPQPCERAFHRRIPGLQRRGGGGRGIASSEIVDPYLYGLTSFSPANYMLTAVGGGEAGVDTGFGGVYLLQHPAILGSRFGGGWNGANGYTCDVSTGYLIQLVDGGGTQRSVSVTLSQSDVGRLILFSFFYDGTNLTLEMHRGELVKSLAVSGFRPWSTRRIAFGGDAGGQYYFGTALASAFYRGTPTRAQRLALYDAIRARGDIPDAMDGATITHRASVKDELRGATNLAGRKTYGARVFTAANYLETAIGAGILGQASGGFWINDVVRIETLPSSQMLAHCLLANGSRGWYLQLNGSVLKFGVESNAGVETLSAGYTVTATDFGRSLWIAGQVSASGQVRLFVNGMQVGADVPLSGTYGPASGIAMRVGVWASTPQPFAGSWFGLQGGHADVSAGELLQSYRDFEATGVLQPITGKTAHRWLVTDPNSVPASVLDTIGTDHITRTGTLELAVDVATAPPAPLQLTDTTTRATVDALMRSGTPSVRIIDPTTDGRRTLGAQGFSLANYLASATGAAILGAAGGYFIAVAMRFDSLPSGPQDIVACANSSGTYAWQFYLSSTLFRFFGQNGVGGGQAAASMTLTAADVGVPLLLIGQHTGTALQFFVCRAGTRPVQTGVDTAITGHTVPPGSDMRIGGIAGLNQPFTSGSVFAVSGGSIGGMTLAEVSAFYDVWEATGRLPVTAKTQHYYDLTTDTIASGVDTVPAIVLDRVGTDHLTRAGLGVQKSGATFLGIGPYSNNVSYWKTAIGGGIQGAATMHAIVDLYLTRIPTAVEHIVGTENGSGWYLFVSAAGVISLGFGGIGEAPIYTLVPGDLNRTLRLVFNAINKDVELWINGTNVGHWNFGSFVVTANASMFVGVRFVLTNALTSGYVKLVQGGSSTSLTPAEIATANADLTQPPPVIAGKTQKRYLFETDVAGGALLPGRSVERIGGGDDMALNGSGLTLAQRTERVWSWEKQPIWAGAQGVAGGFYSTAGGLSGDPAGFGFVWVGSIDSQAVASATRFLCGKRDLGAGFPGFQLGTIGTNSAFQFIVGSATAIATATTSGITAAELGKTFCVVCWFDGSKAHMAVRRVEIGTGSAALSGVYTPSTQPFTVLARADATLPADGTTFRGFIALNGPPSIAEMQAIHDAVISQETIPLTLPREAEAYDVTADVKANGGALPASITGRIAAQTLTQTGAPTLGTAYARAAA